jgi:small conductance mechanosensitive channel
MSNEHDVRLTETLIGQWVAPVGNVRVTLMLEADGTYELGDRSGTFAIVGGKLVLDDRDPATGFNIALANNQLTISGSDVTQPLVFGRRVQLDRYRTWLVDWRPAELEAKARRIGFIALILVLAWLTIYGLRTLSRWLLVGEHGPLRWLTHKRRNRVLTLHSLVLNVVKYMIFFTALGMILSELGVNYTAYLASLSVIGLAIGFGSQGLVQDMVTGLFVIFESQYDVGDMVEISGQTGVVEELGLRMTRLRNYLGQTVVIPNRNIAVVGNYAKGTQRVTIDVAVAPDTVDAAAAALTMIAGEAARQFTGVVVRQPRVDDKLALATGEHFVRLSLRIWPGQTWVIDQQILPRIREGMAARELKIPADRIGVFYYAREQLTTHPLITRYMRGAAQV